MISQGINPVGPSLTRIREHQPVAVAQLGQHDVLVTARRETHDPEDRYGGENTSAWEAQPTLPSHTLYTQSALSQVGPQTVDLNLGTLDSSMGSSTGDRTTCPRGMAQGGGLIN